MTSERKLNMGSGRFPKKGFVNVDHRSDVGADVVHDLNKFPYPFKDKEFDRIEADHVLEHLQEPFRAIKEAHRMLRPGGILHIRVPHFSRALTHPEHEHGFDVSLPLYFNPAFKGGYEGVEFKIKKLRLHWMAQRYLKKITLSPFQYYAGLCIGIPLDFLANISPYACSRIWCFWVGGFEEVEYEFARV
jgi:SAM-dependent methyltransferase